MGEVIDPEALKAAQAAEEAEKQALTQQQEEADLFAEGPEPAVDWTHDHAMNIVDNGTHNEDLPYPDSYEQLEEQPIQATEESVDTDVFNLDTQSLEEPQPALPPEEDDLENQGQGQPGQF